MSDVNLKTLSTDESAELYPDQRSLEWRPFSGHRVLGDSGWIVRRPPPPRSPAGEGLPGPQGCAGGRARPRQVLGLCPPRARARALPTPPLPHAGLGGPGVPGRARPLREPGPRAARAPRPVPPPRPAGARAGSRSRSRWRPRLRRGLFLLSLRPEEPLEPGPCPRAGRRRRPLPSARVSAAHPERQYSGDQALRGGGGGGGARSGRRRGPGRGGPRRRHGSAGTG